MADPLHLISPDGATGMGLGVVSSLVAGILDKTGGWTILVTAIGAALLTGIVMPVAIGRGYTWNDWLGIICILTGLFAGALFAFANSIKRRWLSRGDEAADGLWDVTLGRFIPKKGAKE
jgi:predicted benzoate:H+ symporter BenE